MSDIVDDPNMEPPEGVGEVAEPLRRAIGERYLTYALSTIMHRALPDARDGLKPVHRRIIYAMNRLRLASNGKFLKSAKISGDTMGDFHPHGDAAIYDAMARLAQDFAVRYPLVEGQGKSRQEELGDADPDSPTLLDASPGLLGLERYHSWRGEAHEIVGQAPRLPIPEPERGCRVGCPPFALQTWIGFVMVRGPGAVRISRIEP